MSPTPDADFATLKQLVLDEQKTLARIEADLADKLDASLYTQRHNDLERRVRVLEQDVTEVRKLEQESRQRTSDLFMQVTQSTNQGFNDVKTLIVSELKALRLEQDQKIGTLSSNERSNWVDMAKIVVATLGGGIATFIATAALHYIHF